MRLRPAQTQLNVHCVRQQAAVTEPEVALITGVTDQDGACLSELLNGQARHRPGTRPSRMMDRQPIS